MTIIFPTPIFTSASKKPFPIEKEFPIQFWWSQYRVPDEDSICRRLWDRDKGGGEMQREGGELSITYDYYYHYYYYYYYLLMSNGG